MFISKPAAATVLGCDADEIEKLIGEGLLGVRNEPGKPPLLRRDEIDGLAQILSPAPARPTSNQPRLF